MSKKFDRCVKTQGSPDIWMVREGTKSRVKFDTWGDYVEAGKPPFSIVTEGQLEEYRIASYFRG